MRITEIAFACLFGIGAGWSFGQALRHDSAKDFGTGVVCLVGVLAFALEAAGIGGPRL